MALDYGIELRPYIKKKKERERHACMHAFIGPRAVVQAASKHPHHTS
jgi:hypothetical protein